MKTADMAVTLIDHMGSDLTVANAARVSFDKESEWEITGDEEIVDGKYYLRNAKKGLSSKDAKLIRYLAKHNHWTPFGHCFVQFRIKAPIFVARQLVKHQVGLVWNEVSRRYVDSEPEFWFPEVWRGRPEGSMKQGSSGAVERFTLGGARTYIVSGVAECACRNAVIAYNKLVEGGVAPEQARMILPQNTMTEWYWSGSLAAFARVCKLRMDPHAQEETRMIAEGIAGDMSKLFPVSWKELMG
jgi:thymidylate synthase (FAD)